MPDNPSVTADEGREAAPDTAQADRLYRGFPDFSAWGELTATDLDLWSRFASSLEERRKAATPDALKAAVEVAVRAAALDTGAIEGLYTTDRGFTMTVALQHLAWEQMIEERGAGVRELFEAQLEAYELVLDTVTRKLPITEAWIRSLHETLCAPQKTYRVLTEVGWQEQEFPKGQYKVRPNHVRLTDGSFHAYAPVDQVPSEMHRLLEQVRTPEFEAAHPVLQASYIHYSFVVIHPLADGNGRVARALASVFFYRAESIPLVIFSNQRPAYIDALAAADRGDHSPVISFFLDRGIDTMQLVAESLMTAEVRRPEDLAPRLTQAAENLARLADEEVDNLALRLFNEIDEQFDSQVKALGLVLWRLRIWELAEPLPVRYRVATRSFSAEQLVLRLHAADSWKAELTVSILFGKDRSNPFPFLVCGHGSTDQLEIRLSDVSPELTPGIKLRLSNWVQRHLGRLMSDLERQAGV